MKNEKFEVFLKHCILNSYGKNEEFDKVFDKAKAGGYKIDNFDLKSMDEYDRLCMLYALIDSWDGDPKDRKKFAEFKPELRYIKAVNKPPKKLLKSD